ncbi:MAG: DUF2202 domain-containing protein [Gemmatimonadetes bacterium]|nr:DUF2202 domain-containing protein [Gemmatimonadota bacterium]
MKRNLLAGMLALVTTVAACGEDTGVAPATDLTPALTAVLDTAINDEYHAEYIYLRVLSDFGNVLPFFNVVVAEQRHSASLASLFERRALSTPANRWNLDNVPRFATIRTACAAAATAEMDNIAMYDRFLKLDLPPDVRSVLSNNRRASVDRHLPAFQQCGG